jgi:agmatine deiminase
VRNPGLPKGDVERELQRVLGVRKLIWFPGRRGLDITDCHVDAAVRFVRPGVVVVSRPFSQRRGLVSEWNEVYGEICEVLERETDALGRKLEVNVVEEPDPRFVVGGESVVSGEEGPAASYVNFYFVNGGIVVPVFGDPVADEAAVEMFQRLVPERVVRTVRVNAMPRMGGVLHCVTQQVPLSGAS